MKVKVVRKQEKELRDMFTLAPEIQNEFLYPDNKQTIVNIPEADVEPSISLDLVGMYTGTMPMLLKALNTKSTNNVVGKSFIDATRSIYFARIHHLISGSIHNTTTILLDLIQSIPSMHDSVTKSESNPEAEIEFESKYIDVRDRIIHEELRVISRISTDVLLYSKEYNSIRDDEEIVAVNISVHNIVEYSMRVYDILLGMLSDCYPDSYDYIVNITGSIFRASIEDTQCVIKQYYAELDASFNTDVFNPNELPINSRRLLSDDLY